MSRVGSKINGAPLALMMPARVVKESAAGEQEQVTQVEQEQEQVS